MDLVPNALSQIWLTPEYAKTLYLPDKYDDYCPYPRNGFDILDESIWKNKEIIKYINPPFKLLPKLAKLIHKKSKEGFKMIICCPVRYNTIYFQSWLKPVVTEIVIANKRIKFIDANNICKSHNGAPFVCNFLYINCSSGHVPSKIILAFA